MLVLCVCLKSSLWPSQLRLLAVCLLNLGSEPAGCTNTWGCWRSVVTSNDLHKPDYVSQAATSVRPEVLRLDLRLYCMLLFPEVEQCLPWLDTDQCSGTASVHAVAWYLYVPPAQVSYRLCWIDMSIRILWLERKNRKWTAKFTLACTALMHIINQSNRFWL